MTSPKSQTEKRYSASVERSHISQEPITDFPHETKIVNDISKRIHVDTASSTDESISASQNMSESNRYSRYLSTASKHKHSIFIAQAQRTRKKKITLTILILLAIIVFIWLFIR